MLDIFSELVAEKYPRAGLLSCCHRCYNLIFMQQKDYSLNSEKYKNIVDQLDWSDIDSKPRQSIECLYSFVPAAQVKLYYDRFLLCLKEQEETERALHLSTLILCLNSNNYYAMMLREECLRRAWGGVQSVEEFERLVVEELHFCNCLLSNNPKEYQVWNHKKDIVASGLNHEQLKVDRQRIESSEMQFVFDLMVDGDEKNYHAWDYLTWWARLTGDLEQSIQNTQKLLFLSKDKGEDGVTYQSLWVNCYSCWSYRFNLILDLPTAKKQQYLQADLHKIYEFTLKNPQNQCAWGYLKGLLDLPELPAQLKAQTLSSLYTICQSVKESNRYAWDVLLCMGLPEMKSQALKALAQTDPIRKLYYQYLASADPQ